MYYNLSLNPSLFLDSEDETNAYELMIIGILHFYRKVAIFLDLQKGKYQQHYVITIPLT